MLKKVNKIKVNIKTCHITYNVLREFYSEDYSTNRFYLEQSLKVIILYIYKKKIYLILIWLKIYYKIVF